MRESVLIVLVVALLTGCTSGPAPSATDRATDTISERGGQVSLADGPSVSFPKGSVAGSGKVIIRKTTADHKAPAAPSPYLGIAGAYEISLQDTRLTGPITLTFPVPSGAPSSKTAVNLGYYDPTAQRWHLVPSRYDPVTHTVSATVTHLSWWNPFSWNYDALGDAVRSAHDAFLRVAAPTPSCAQEQKAREVGIKVTSDSGDRIRWCYGLSKGKPILKVANTKGYPVAVTYPRTWTVDNPGDGMSVEAGLMAVMEKSLIAGRGEKAIMLTGGATASFYPTSSAPGGKVTATASGGGYLATALAFGIDTLGMTMGKVPGAPAPKLETSEKVLKGVLDSTCLLGYTKVMANPVDSLDAAGKLMLDAYSVGFGCLQDQWEKYYGLEGFIGSFVMVAVTWLATGIKTVLDGLEGLKDSIVYFDGYTIALKSTLSPTIIVKIDPFTAAGALKSPYAVDRSQVDSGPLDCSYDEGSSSAVNVGTHWCGGTADSANACWATPRYPDSLLCLQSAWAKSLVLRRAINLPPKTSAPATPEPLGIELSDGTRWWLRIGGSWGGRADDLRGAYGCDKNSACSYDKTNKDLAVLTTYEGQAIDRSGPTWTVRIGELGNPNQKFPAPSRLTVRKAWFIENSITQ